MFKVLFNIVYMVRQMYEYALGFLQPSLSSKISYIFQSTSERVNKEGRVSRIAQPMFSLQTCLRLIKIIKACHHIL